MDTSSPRPSFSSRLSVDLGPTAVASSPPTSAHNLELADVTNSATSRPAGSRPTRAYSHSHNLSSSSSASSNPATRKSRQAEPGTTEANAGRASLSMPPPPAGPLKNTLASTHSRRESTNSDPASEDLAVARIQAGGHLFPGDFGYVGADLDDTPKLNPSIHNDVTGTHHQLPEPAIVSSRTSFSDDAKRLSVSSMYSLVSARGAPSSAASEKGSDSGQPVHRTVSGLMAASTGKGLGGSGAASGAAQSEAEVSNITVTTNSQGSGGGHHLSPRDFSRHNLNDMVKRNATAPAAPRSEPTSVPRPAQPTRSRSRAKRRFSGSTATSSHSPSSDRVPHKREREEQRPAPLGVIGVCALDVKARSKPSRNILNRLIQNSEFDVVVFGDKVILDEEVENWPVCDYLISFYSDGFPLEKAIAYVKARKPFSVNDVPMQKVLWDRRVCLRLLDKIDVPTPQRIEVNRDGGPKVLTPDIVKHIKDISGIALEPTDPEKIPPPQKVELLAGGDVLSVDGNLLKKPFVEKPISGEDHNIIIYFPNSSGGGARKLFRKIGNKSSEFVEDLITPRAISHPDESFVYEKFMRVDNAEDVKAYTVGPEYCHAETRKSPVVDGIVRRNTHGKEIRYVAELNSEERETARKISTTFGQRVCGFDFLRSGRKSYVIDVNGWSFVKDNDEYYNYCAKILRKMFIEERARRGGVTPPIPSPALSEVDFMSHRGILHKDKDAQLSALLGGQAAKSTNSVAANGGENAGLDQKSLTIPHISDVLPKSDSALVSTLQQAVAASSSQTTDALVNSLPATAPSTVPTTPSVTDIGAEELQPTPPPPLPKHVWRLKGMVSVMRHADRTPKQKYKFTFHTEPFIELLKGHQEEVLLIGEAALASVADAVDMAMRQGIEDPNKLRILRNVLIKKGTWSGTKVQIKPMFRKKKTDKTDEMTTLEEGVPETVTPPVGDKSDQTDGTPSEYSPRIPPRRHDSLSGLTMSKFTAAENSLEFDKLQLIVKWGGEPTHSARYQSQELGENMRNDLLLMNRDILDEVHVFSSSERRVMTSAQIWAASFLDKKELDEDYIIIRKDLLDDSNAAKDEMDKVKKKLKGLLRKGSERPSQFAWPENMPEPSEVQTRVVQLMNFHRKVMQYNYGKLHGNAVHSLSAVSNTSLDKLSGGSEGSTMSFTGSLAQANAINSIQPRWCCGEDSDLFRERWEKLFSEFCDGEKIDPSKISELYDTMKFDALHNRAFLEWVFTPPKHMLEEEWSGSGTTAGGAGGKEGKQAERDPEEGKSSEDSRTSKGQPVPVAEEKDPKTDRAEPKQTVRRIFRRRSWMNGFRHGAEATAPEQYFGLYKGNSHTKAKTDARLESLRELYQLAKVLFDFICPQEYGISDSEKLEIGLLTSLPLLKEVVQDLEEMQASDEAKAFFYFTKESHIYTLLNCIFEGGIETKIQRSTIPELDYLSQICFELYESETKPKAAATGTIAAGTESSTYEYSIRITLSPGCHVYDPLDIQLDSRHCISCAPRRSLTPHGNWKKVIETLRARFHRVKLPLSFLAVNLSDAFSFQERQNSDSEGLQMKALDHRAPGAPVGNGNEDEEDERQRDVTSGSY